MMLGVECWMLDYVKIMEDELWTELRSQNPELGTRNSM